MARLGCVLGVQAAESSTSEASVPSHASLPLPVPFPRSPSLPLARAPRPPAAAPPRSCAARPRRCRSTRPARARPPSCCRRCPPWRARPRAATRARPGRALWPRWARCRPGWAPWASRAPSRACEAAARGLLDRAVWPPPARGSIITAGVRTGAMRAAWGTWCGKGFCSRAAGPGAIVAARPGFLGGGVAFFPAHAPSCFG
jgi:hypothetical protein